MKIERQCSSELPNQPYYLDETKGMDRCQATLFLLVAIFRMKFEIQCFGGMASRVVVDWEAQHYMSSIVKRFVEHEEWQAPRV